MKRRPGLKLFPAPVWPSRIPLASKLALIGIVVVLLAGVNFYFVRAVMNDGNHIAGVVSVAGKLRMLSRKIEIDVMQYIGLPKQNARPVRNGMTEFEQLMQALSQGGRVFDTQLPPMNAWHRHLLDAVRRHWIQYRVDIEAILVARLYENADPGAVSPENMLALHRQSLSRATALLHASEQMVASILRDLELSRQRAIRGLLWSIGLLIVVLILSLLIMHRSVARPLGQLIAGARRIARGDYHVRFRHRSRDELGALAAALDEAVRKMSATVDEQRHKYHGLQLSEHMLKGLAEMPGLGVCSILHRQLIYANQNLADLLGYDSVDQLLGVSTQSLFVDSNCRHFWDQDALQGMDPQGVSVRCLARRFDGSQVLIDIQAQRCMQGEEVFAVCLVRMASAENVAGATSEPLKC